jgi:hypothetical protein
MKQILTVFFLVIFWQLVGQQKKISTSDFSTKEYYTDITFLSEGEFLPNKNKTGKETAFRVIITTSEIYNMLILEKVSYGSEGGNKKIIKKTKVDLQQIWTEFEISGEISGIEFSKWLTSDSFELKIKDTNYLFKNISSSTIDVSRL